LFGFGNVSNEEEPKAEPSLPNEADVDPKLSVFVEGWPKNEELAPPKGV
jgi:hypothetical protein